MCLLTCPTAAFPSRTQDEPQTRIIEHKNNITVQTTGCRPLTTEELCDLIGEKFDRTKMGCDIDSSKRSFSTQSVIDDDDDVGDYLNDEEAIDEISENGDTISVQSKLFMRRKRDATVIDSDNENNGLNTEFLYQNLAHDSISKRKSRQKRSSKTKQFHPPWECKMKPIWLHMKPGYFPSRILDGKCKSDKCFFGMYTCNPVKYAVRVLKRDPNNACRPLPLIGKTTTYVESWEFERIHVTVACECGQSWKSAKRKRNKGKNRNRHD